MVEAHDNLGKVKAATRRKLKLISFSWKNAQQQAESIRKIGEAKDPHDAPMLIECLDSTYHGAVRAAAALALGELKCEEAVPHLIAMLECDTHSLQNAAAEALGQIGDQRAVKSLVSLLKHPTESVRNAAADAAVKLGPEAIGWIGELLKKSSFEVRASAATALGQIQHDRAFYALETALGDTDSIVRREVAAAIANQGRQFAERIGTHLESGDPLVRHTAALALQRMRAPQSVEMMVNHLPVETQPDIRELVWKALAACKFEPAVKRHVAKESIESGNWDRAERSGADAVGPFVELFRSGDSDAKKIAESSLLHIGLAGAEPLSQALSDLDQPVRRLAARILTQLNWEPADENDALRLRIAGGKYSEVQTPAAIPFLVRILFDQSEIEREAAVDALGHCADEAAVEALAHAASDHTARVRIRAAVALANFQTERARQILEHLAADTDFRVASAAHVSLRKPSPAEHPPLDL
jgi:HEAT repeat protein